MTQVSTAPIAKKLGIKPGWNVLVLNAPDGYHDLLRPLPEATRLATSPGAAFDIVQAFAATRAELDSVVHDALSSLKDGGSLWFCFPKRASGISTDLTRDEGWDHVWDAGFEIVSLVSIDSTWSAARFRPATGEPHRAR